eukprot:5768270-Prymnesium_polylepis.1
MQPYRLDWPHRPEEEGGPYAGATAKVRTAGTVREATWYDEDRGYFPDGDPQRWAHRREIWIVYDHWARAKGVLTGIIALPD